MHILKLSQVSLSFPNRALLRAVNLDIDNRARMGLVGANGCGKSTLMKVIAEQIKADSGVIQRVGQISVGYLPQDIELQADQTLLEATSVFPPKLAEVVRTLTHLEEQMADPSVYEHERKLARVMERHEETIAEYERLGIAGFASRVRRVLNQLGFTEAHFTLATHALSGGQRKLIALARLLLESPDVLLLDEPDNHLDMVAKHELEQLLNGYLGAVVIISHDRYLLDETVKQIIELENGQLTVYSGNYSQYAIQKELNQVRQQQAFITQQKQIAKIEEAIKRFELWAKETEDPRHIRQARSRRKMLERMEAEGEIIEQVRQRRLMLLKLEGQRGSEIALRLRDVAVAFDDNPLMLDIHLEIRHGERVGLIGKNGAGKSVLFQLVLGQLAPTLGSVQVGNSTRLGYYAQEHQTLEPFLHQSPIDFIQKHHAMKEGEVVSQLLKFAFSYEQTRQAIGTLSGGERSRLQMLHIMLQRPNLLILDEPTNNMDIQSVEVMEEAIEDFDGAVFVISHDRYFLDRVVERLYELRDGSIHSYIGGYSDYVDLQKITLAKKPSKTFP